MKNNIKKWFTLVELLVTITILAIISVVAYQNFGWATDKAVAWRKISDISTIETSLQQYNIDKNHYPLVDIYDKDKNVFGYNSGERADPSNSFTVGDADKKWAEILKVNNPKWGWKIVWKNWIENWKGEDYSNKQIWAKWTISQDTLWKQYLTKDLYDPELGDIKIWDKKAIEQWIGRYVYAVYKKPLSENWSSNSTWTAYNIAYSIKKEGTDTYITKISWPYDPKSCFENEKSCPETLIWSWTNILRNDQEVTKNSNETNQGIPYPLGNF